MITLMTVTEKLAVGAVDPRYSTLKIDSKKNLYFEISFKIDSEHP